MSSTYTTGCMIGMDKVVNRSYTAAADVVKACNSINGSLYILRTWTQPQKKDVDSGGYSLFYENILRKELEEMKSFGEIILGQSPDAEIILYLSIHPYYIDDYNSPTNFCNDRILYYNEYFEAIENWANCKNVKIVLKTAVRSIYASGFFDWLNYLRPRSVHSYDIHKLAELHPYIVLRNYPDGINNWTVDPCINWETSRPAIKANYFETKHVGAIFYTDKIRRNEPLTVNEYKIMLQFLMNKFVTVEVVLKNDIEDFIAAYNWVQLKSNLVDRNNKILINYHIPQPVNDLTGATSEELIDSVFDVLKKNRQNSVQGIHFDFLTKESACLINLSHPTFMSKVLLAKNHIENISFGVLLDYNCCMNYIELLVSNNGSKQPILKHLNQIEYLVCEEKHQSGNLTYEIGMGRVLDSHLYLKKAFQEFSPHLELYFRVIFTDFSHPINAFSDAYMKTVSHLMQSATAYDLNYLIIQAFDEETTQSGWWQIKDFGDLSDPLMFVEKEADLSNQNTWRPDAFKEESTLDFLTFKSYVLLTIVFGVILTAVSTFFYLRYKKLSQFLSDDEVKEFVNGGSNGTGAPGSEQTGSQAEYLKFNTKYKLHISDLHIDIQTILGKGNFGTVYKGTVKEIQAAIKTPNKNCSKTCFKSVLSEVKVLSYIGEHSNIVGFLGAYTNEMHKGVLYIATEFCANGSLETFLRNKNGVVTSKDEQFKLAVPERECAVLSEDLCRFSMEIASGMEHLEGKHIVHGDLSLRNVLLDDNYTCKIGDFGLSRKLYDYQKYVKTSQEPLPWKWMAYESLTKMEFTSKPDVWSYGVTVWEIFSLGKIPYDTINWTLEFSNELRKGLRLSQPEFASQEIYKKLLDCWNLEPVQRPAFTELKEGFKELNKTEYLVLQEAERVV